MAEPQKPFVCNIPECGMSFTNEDHLHVHTKKHDMVLQLGSEQKAAFISDQTPTPTRFIRNCEEVGLFQDLQNVNPFDEGFKRAMEKPGILAIEGAISSDELHTPQMFPLTEHADVYTTNNQRNITISRSSSDESGAVKEYETTTISKLTNEVTTISRVVGKQDDRITDDVSVIKETHNNETVSYSNNVIKIHSNVEIRNGVTNNSVIKDATCVMDMLDRNELKPPPVMSQKSFDCVVESLTSDICQNEVTDKDDNIVKILKRNYSNMKSMKSTEETDCIEVIVKLPNGKQVKMKSEEVDKVQDETKERLKSVITSKAEKTQIQKHFDAPIVLQPGTLVPVTILNQSTPMLLATNLKVPIQPIKQPDTAKRKKCDKIEVGKERKYVANSKQESLASRSAAAKRYRERLKSAMQQQTEENKLLKETNNRLMYENAKLKQLFIDHLKNCNTPADLKAAQDKIQNGSKS